MEGDWLAVTVRNRYYGARSTVRLVKGSTPFEVTDQDQCQGTRDRAKRDVLQPGVKCVLKERADIRR